MCDARHPCAKTLAALLALWLTACGGGGGGGNSDPEATEAGPDAPTMIVGLVASAGSDRMAPQDMANLTISSAAQALQLAQFGTDLAHRMAMPGGPLTLAITCAGSGTLNLTLEDRDGNGYATPGDTVTGVLTQCGLPVLQRGATGTVQVDILPGAAARIDSDLQARISLGSGLALAEGSGAFAITGTLPAGTLLGSLAVHWSASETGSSLSATSTSDDNLRLDTPSGLTSLAWRRIAVDKQVRFDEASVTNTLSFVLERGGLRVVVETTSPWRADINQYASSGTVDVRTAGGRTLRLRPGTARTAPIVTEVVNSAGQLLESGLAFWQAEHGALTWDGRLLMFGVNPASGDYFELPRDVVGAIPVGMYTLFPPAAGVQTTLTIDRLFLHPVLQTPGATSPEATFRWQLGSALEDVQPSLFFRFRDDAGGQDEILPRDHIAATATRRGALFLIRPTESLRHGATFQLQASTDGINWLPATPATLRKRNGEQVAAEGTLTFVHTPHTLLVNIDRTRTIVVGADDDVTLRATVTTSAGQGIASMRWEQFLGEPLILDAPDAAITPVRYPAGSPRAFGKALLGFTVTDTLGNVERARVLVRAGDMAPAGAVHYKKSTVATLSGQVFRSIGLGSGAVLANSPQPGVWALRVLPPPSVEPLGLTLGAPDGALLAPGPYENATLLTPEPGQPVLSCEVIVCTAPASGRFDVLEVAYATDGSITRLAVDYNQTSPPGTYTETVSGSYRYNSLVPVRH